ncbi:MAG: helix-turn-helix transcriptional regulator [Blautia sp.]|nr:helix-turn-helix transcriptional regulator [Blautia sp.]
MPDLKDLSQDRRLRNHFNIDKKRRTNHHRQSAPHFHSYYELYYMQEGSCRSWLTDTVYTLEKGEFILIPPGEYHLFSYDRQGMHDRFALYFDNERLTSAMGPFVDSFITLPAQAFHFQILPDFEDELLLMLSRMLEYYRMDNDYGEFMLSHMVPVFLLSLTRHIRQVSEKSQVSSKDAALQRAAQYISEHYREPLTLEDAAAVAGFTPAYFSRSFKALAGIGFRDYLTHMRLKEAVRLLRTTQLPIQEISGRCGFASSNYFGDVFRSAYKVSPREYRRRDDV